MIEPYETALRNASTGFTKLGFSLVHNTEYLATFSDGSYSIELSTDRYYHPELAGVICDPTGKKFEIGLVWQFGLDERGTPSEIRLQGIAEYLGVMLDQLLWFLAAHREHVRAFPSEHGATYKLRADAFMSKIIKLKRTITQ